MSAILDGQKAHIIKLLKEKSVMKHEVFNNTLAAFELTKTCLNEIARGLIAETEITNKNIPLEVTETKRFSIQLKIAGDILEFLMHTNVFEFERNHPMFRTGYIKQNEFNSFCGIINVYNFLSDSFKYNRLNDLGSLICRIFVNREMKFFIEARGPIGIKYSSFSFEPLNKEQLTEIINELIIFSITFDLFAPPYEFVKEVTVNEIIEQVTSMNLRTGKRLGFDTSRGPTNEDDTNLYI